MVEPTFFAEASECLRKYYLRAALVAERAKQQVPTAYYRFGIAHCWKCHSEIIVFAWPGQIPGQEPRPTTIRKTFSKSVGDSYWANNCPLCSSLQGEFFLFHEPDGPFFGIHVTTNSEAAFLADMEEIAAYANQFEESKGGVRPASTDEVKVTKRASTIVRVNDLVPNSPGTEWPKPEQGMCEFCGKITTEWWSFERKTGRCKCNDCRDSGRYS